MPVAVNSVCVAPCDEGWYRCQVVAYDEEGGMCDIKYLDYGGYHSIAANEFRQIRSEERKGAGVGNGRRTRNQKIGRRKGRRINLILSSSTARWIRGTQRTRACILLITAIILCTKFSS